MKDKILLLAVLLLVSATGIRAGTVEEVKARKKLIVLSYPHPYSAFVKEMSPGQYDGVDVKIMKTFANRLGVALEIQPVENLNELIPGLLAGKGDVLASGFSITKEREKVVSFSDPYFAVKVMVVTRKDSSIATIEDLKGKKGSVVKGSSKETRLKSIPGAIAYHVENSTMHYDAVASRKVDFALIDSPSWLANVDRLPDLKAALELPETEYYGYAVAPGSDLLPAINAHLKEMSESGMLYTLIRRQLGDKAVEMMKLIQKE